MVALTGALPRHYCNDVLIESQKLRMSSSKHSLKQLLLRMAVCTPVAYLLSGQVACQAERLDLGSFTNLAQRCGSTVNALTLAAIAKTETSFQPLAVSDNTTHRSQIFDAAWTASSAARRLIAAGHSVDIGLMQINSANLARLGITVEDALDPCKSISTAATILFRNYSKALHINTEQGALRDAISMYNTGNAKYGYRNGYVRRVEEAARSLQPDRLTGANVRFAAQVMPVRPGYRYVNLSTRPARLRLISTGTNSASWDVWSRGRNAASATREAHSADGIWVL